MAVQGTMSYPGILRYESLDFCDLTGVTPAVATIQCYPQDDLPSPNGDIVINYGSNQITLKYMHVDSIAYHQDGGGKIVTVRLVDERWAWDFYQITGNYNIRFPNGLVDPAHEKKPQELATLLFQMLGVDAFDVSLLPNDARPEADWENANAAAELEKLCNGLGCRVVPVRSLNLWRICVTGDGNDLPDGIPYENPGQGINPKETPDYLKVVTAPFLFQVRLQLKGCARDTDHAWKDLTALSYQVTTPPNGRPIAAAAGFGFDYKKQSYISAVRTIQPDGTGKSPREFALESVFKCWRVDPVPSTIPTQTAFDGTLQFWLPGYQNYVSRRQLILSNELVESYTDELDVDHKRPAYIVGSFWGRYAENGMYPAGTRIDKQADSYERREEPASFNLAIDHLDTDRSIVTTSRQLMTYYPTNVTDAFSAFGVASLFLTCAVQVKDPVTWQPVRYEKYLQIGNGTNKNFCQVILQEDIQPWTIQNYDVNGNPVGGYVDYTAQSPLRALNRNNKDDADQMCNYYLNAYAQTFMIVATKTRTYIGLFPIDMDGAICQVQWTIDKGGSSTRASEGTEHNYQIPTYEQRLQRNATRNQAALAQYQKYRTERRAALLGGNNTI